MSNRAVGALAEYSNSSSEFISPMLTCSARKFKLPLCNSTILFLTLMSNNDPQEVFFNNILAFVMTAFVSEYILCDYMK